LEKRNPRSNDFSLVRVKQEKKETWNRNQVEFGSQIAEKKKLKERGVIHKSLGITNCQDAKKAGKTARGTSREKD